MDNSKLVRIATTEEVSKYLRVDFPVNFEGMLLSDGFDLEGLAIQHYLAHERKPQPFLSDETTSCDYNVIVKPHSMFGWTLGSIKIIEELDRELNRDVELYTNKLDFNLGIEPPYLVITNQEGNSRIKPIFEGLMFTVQDLKKIS